MLALLLAVAALAAADTPESDGFIRILGGPGVDRGVFVEPTRDGGYAVVGVTANTEGRGEDVYLVKLDSAGELQWTRTYGGDDEDNGWCVRELEDGYLIGGFTRSFGAGGYDGYLIRTDAAGNEIWSRTHGGETDDRLWGVILTTDGGFALVGETVVAGTEAQDVWLLKTDAMGEEVWSRSYGGAAVDRGFAIAQATDGGFVLVGQTFSEGAGDRDAYVIKTDGEGELLWTRTFGGEVSDVGHGVDLDADDSIFVFGYTTSLAETGDDPFLIKLDSQGNTLWTRVLNFPGICRSITGARGANGGLFLTGFQHDPLSRETAVLLIRADDDGRMLSSEKLLSTNTGQSFGYTVRATADGGCVLTGHTTVDSAGELDLFVIKAR